MKTWQIESIVVLIILSSSLLLKEIGYVDIICLFAIWITFLHAQVADRLQEKQSQKTEPDVDCFRWSNRYFIAKEVLWIIFFLLIRSYPALIGAIVFSLYPYWRKFYRKKYPLK